MLPQRARWWIVRGFREYVLYNDHNYHKLVHCWNKYGEHPAGDRRSEQRNDRLLLLVLQSRGSTRVFVLSTIIVIIIRTADIGTNIGTLGPWGGGCYFIRLKIIIRAPVTNRDIWVEP